MLAPILTGRPYIRRLPTLAAILALILLLAAGCAGTVRRADYLPVPALSPQARPTPVLFRGVELLLPPGAAVGFESSAGRFCGWPRYPLGRSALRGAIDEKFLGQTFHDALEAQGYDVVGGLDIAYDLDDEIDRAEYSVTAKVRAVELEICERERDNLLVFFTTRSGTAGEFFMQVDLTVYDALRRHVVHKASSEGYARRRVPDEEGLTLMFADAFAMAAHNLGANPVFRDLLVSGIVPAKDAPVDGDFAATRDDGGAGLFDPREIVTLPPHKASREAFTKNIDRKRAAAVMIQKFGHGSGFFITDQGHILTNAHVVGDSRRTRIVTADGAHKLVAEVLRVDKTRDVALLRLEQIPADLRITTLPLRREWPAVGETVYAIGAPADDRKLQDSVTKGIISAHRRDMKFYGIRQNYLQADVEIHPGSSGGPLVDEFGNIAGLAVLAFTDSGESGVGLNFFIPIDEALRALAITPR